MNSKGFTFVEVMLGAAIFMVILLSAYYAYASIYTSVADSHIKVLATDLANEQFEIARNLSFADVGTVGGVPSGKLLGSQSLVRSGITFQVNISVKNVDNPFDGTAGGSPNDTNPGDYKSVEVKVSCSTCKNFSPSVFTSLIAPLSLEP